MATIRSGLVAFEVIHETLRKGTGRSFIMIKFVLLSTQRSGSSFLGTSLNSHPFVNCYEEVFMPKNANAVTYRTFRRSAVRRQFRHFFSRRRSLEVYLERLFNSSPTAAATGFKFMYGQAKLYPEVIDWCHKNDVGFVHLIRNNYLKMIVSRILARQRGLYHSTKTVAPSKITLNANQILHQLDEMRDKVVRHRDVISRSRNIEVFYEDYVEREQDEAKRILEFLGVDYIAPLSSNLVKINPNSVRDLVCNYDEIASRLRGSPYARLLES